MRFQALEACVAKFSIAAGDR